jgi:ATP-dependent Clp protease ATP-binding subunit ClpB
MLNPDRLTVKSAEALNDAIGRARRAGNPLVYDAHLLGALLDQEEGIVAPLLQKLGVNLPALRAAVSQEAARYPKQSDAQPSLSREISAVFDGADEEARKLGDVYVSTEDLLHELACK